jgi:hypothetical protein
MSQSGSFSRSFDQSKHYQSKPTQAQFNFSQMRPIYKLAARALGVLTLLLIAAVQPQRALAQRPLGVDVSSYQGGSINWSQVKSAGFVFAWTKATEGEYYVDADFAINENNAKAAGVYMGAYDFCRPDLYTPASEASYFWSHAGSYIQGDGLTLNPMLDFETFNGFTGATSYSDWCNQWCNWIVSEGTIYGP